MKLGISGLFLKPAQVGGAEFTLRGLLVGLAQLPEVQPVVFLPPDLTPWLTEATGELRDRVQVVPVPIVQNRFVTEAMRIQRYAKDLNLDGLIYPNYFTPWRWSASIPVVTLIHDLNYAHFPQLFSATKRTWLNMAHRLTLMHADRTVTVSDFVRRDLARVYGMQPRSAPVTIANPVIWSRFTPTVAPQSPLTQPFILSVANHYQHKNLRTLLQAFQQLPPDLSAVHLVLVGQLPARLVGMRRDRCDDIPALVATLNLQGRVHVTGYISDAELGWYYQQASLFVYPSLFEGFGLSPVEAIGMGLPTLTTRCTAIPEATLHLAHYVDDPLSAAEFAERMALMLRDRPSFLPTPEAITQIRTTYDPVTIAQQYVALFKEISRKVYTRHRKGKASGQ